jgi:hypothetical protein
MYVDLVSGIFSLLPKFFSRRDKRKFVSPPYFPNALIFIMHFLLISFCAFSLCTNCIGTNCIGIICIGTNCINTNCIGNKFYRTQIVSGTYCIRNKLYREQIVSGTNCIGYREILYTNIIYTLQSLYVTKFIQTLFIRNKIYTNIFCTKTKLIHDYHWGFLLQCSFIHLKSASPPANGYSPCIPKIMI